MSPYGQLLIVHEERLDMAVKQIDHHALGNDRVIGVDDAKVTATLFRRGSSSQGAITGADEA